MRARLKTRAKAATAKVSSLKIKKELPTPPNPLDAAIESGWKGQGTAGWSETKHLLVSGGPSSGGAEQPAKPTAPSADLGEVSNPVEGSGAGGGSVVPTPQRRGSWAEAKQRLAISSSNGRTTTPAATPRPTANDPPTLQATDAKAGGDVAISSGRTPSPDPDPALLLAATTRRLQEGNPTFPVPSTTGRAGLKKRLTTPKSSPRGGKPTTESSVLAGLAGLEEEKGKPALVLLSQNGIQNLEGTSLQALEGSLAELSELQAQLPPASNTSPHPPTHPSSSPFLSL